jgi:ribonuclease P protein component
MLNRAHRFHGYNSLRFVRRQGKVVRGPVCALKFVANSRIKQYRVAVVVSKKVHKSAVVRNRIRRRIYEIIRQNVAPDQPVDLVFIIYSEEAATMPADRLKKQILSQLRSAQIKLV